MPAYGWLLCECQGISYFACWDLFVCSLDALNNVCLAKARTVCCVEVSGPSMSKFVCGLNDSKYGKLAYCLIFPCQIQRRLKMRFILRALYIHDGYRAGVLAEKHFSWLRIMSLCNEIQFWIAFYLT